MLLAVQNYESCISNINPIILGTNIIPFIREVLLSIQYLYTKVPFLMAAVVIGFGPEKKQKQEREKKERYEPDSIETRIPPGRCSLGTQLIAFLMTSCAVFYHDVGKAQKT